MDEPGVNRGANRGANRGGHKGVIEGASRILRELLRTPKVRETARLLLSELDPENAPLLLRTLRAEDPDLFLNLLAASPKLANAAIGVVGELLAQIQTLPPGMTVAFVGRIMGEIDAEALGEAAGRAAVLATGALRGGETELDGARKRFAAGYGESVRAAGKDPDELSDLLTAAGLSAGTAFLKTINEHAARGDSATGHALADVLAQVRLLQRYAEDADD